MRDAVFNLNRATLLPNAFSSGNFEKLAELLDDRLHQPYRARVMKPLFKVIDAAKKAGAWGAFLSGSGSTIMAVATKNMEEISKAMLSTLEENGWTARILRLKTDNRGIRKRA